MNWLWSLPLTLLAFTLAKVIASRYKLTLLNPFLLSIALIIPLLLLTNTSYQHYFEGSQLLHELLQPAIVALAFPLYEQLAQIRQRWKSLLIICLAGCVAAIISGTALALWLQATPEIAASVLPKSVTTPIAMAIAQSLDGIPAISALCVIIAGILGASLGHWILDRCRIKSKIARGLAIGSAAHALGTARCAEQDLQEGAFSSLALVICGIITSLLAPFCFPLLLELFG